MIKNITGTSLKEFLIGLGITQIAIKNNAGILEIAHVTKIGGAANYSEFEANGTLEFNGDATVGKIDKE